MKQYLNLLETVLTTGKPKADRTGTGTLTIFDYTLRFDFDQGFPLVTTKSVHVKSVIYELLWFLRGEPHIQFLKKHGITIWNEWANNMNYVGPLYGYQWRHWSLAPNQKGFKPYKDSHIDQIKKLIVDIQNNPDSRRLLVSAWNVGDLLDMALPPCHFAFQCQVMNGRLNMKVFVRSLDVFLGAPFDIASYGFLLLLLCRVTRLIPGELVISATDVHLYNNHIDQAKLQLTREPRPLPFVYIDTSLEDIDKATFETFNIVGYNPHPAIKAPVAI